MTPTYSWESWFKDTWLYSTWGCLYTNLSFSDLKSILEFDFLKICSLYYYLKIHLIHSGPTLPLGTMIWTNLYRVPFTQWCFVEFGWDRLSSGEVDINVKMFTATPTTTDNGQNLTRKTHLILWFKWAKQDTCPCIIYQKCTSKMKYYFKSFSKNIH